VEGCGRDGPIEARGHTLTHKTVDFIVICPSQKREYKMLMYDIMTALLFCLSGELTSHDNFFGTFNKGKRRRNVGHCFKDGEQTFFSFPFNYSRYYFTQKNRFPITHTSLLRFLHEALLYQKVCH